MGTLLESCRNPQHLHDTKVYMHLARLTPGQASGSFYWSTSPNALAQPDRSLFARAPTRVRTSEEHG
jgi:hypothetical protein